MNEKYLIVMGVVIVYTLFQMLYNGAMYDMGIKGVSTIITTIISGAMLILSGVLPIGEDIVDVKPASNTRINNELIIQAEEYPTQIISDIQFIDKPVQIKKITTQNSWGGDINTTYKVEPLIKTDS